MERARTSQTLDEPAKASVEDAGVGRGAQASSSVARQIARELGLNPKKFGKLDNHRQERTKHAMFSTGPAGTSLPRENVAGSTGLKKPANTSGIPRTNFQGVCTLSCHELRIT